MTTFNDTNEPGPEPSRTPGPATTPSPVGPTAAPRGSSGERTAWWIVFGVLTFGMLAMAGAWN